MFVNIWLRIEWFFVTWFGSCSRHTLSRMNLLHGIPEPKSTLGEWEQHGDTHHAIGIAVFTTISPGDWGVFSIFRVGITAHEVGSQNRASKLIYKRTFATGSPGICGMPFWTGSLFSIRSWSLELSWSEPQVMINECNCNMHITFRWDVYTFTMSIHSTGVHVLTKAHLQVSNFPSWENPTNWHWGCRDVSRGWRWHWLWSLAQPWRLDGGVVVVS